MCGVARKRVAKRRQVKNRMKGEEMRKAIRTEHVHRAVRLEVTFVPNEDDGNRFGVFDAQDLFVVGTNQVKRIPFRD